MISKKGFINIVPWVLGKHNAQGTIYNTQDTRHKIQDIKGKNMASEYTKFMNSLSESKRNRLLEDANNASILNKIPDSKLSTFIRDYCLKEKWDKEKEVERKKRVEREKLKEESVREMREMQESYAKLIAKNKSIQNPVQSTQKPTQPAQKSAQSAQPAQKSAQPTQKSAQPTQKKNPYGDEAPLKYVESVPIIRSKPIYSEEPAEDVPDKYYTGVDNMRRFRFRASDSIEEMFAKINYIRAILKGKKVIQKKIILQYYDIPLEEERRSNQMYLYGSKNLKNRKYKFYVGRDS